VDDSFGSCLRRGLAASLHASPRDMLQQDLDVCMELTGASGSSILAEDGPSLRFLCSNVPELIGKPVPWESIAGATVRGNRVIYTFAPADKRHFKGIDNQTTGRTRYLLSVPIPCILDARSGRTAGRSIGALQLLFDEDVLTGAGKLTGSLEFSLDEFRAHPCYDRLLRNVFWLLPNIAFGIEVMRLRETSYQAIHELKNKLVGVLSWIECLEEDLREIDPQVFGTEAIQEDFSLARQAAGEGAELARQYLAFTKLYMPEFEPADPGKVVRGAAADVQAFASRTAPEVQVVVEAPTDSVICDMDPHQIRMALFNLGKNAVECLAEHCPRKGCVRYVLELGSQDHIVIMVADNGPGMPEDVYAELFRPFKSRKQGGTGLGLTITKKIIDVHAGILRCETGPDGTRFIIELPCPEVQTKRAAGN